MILTELAGSRRGIRVMGTTMYHAALINHDQTMLLELMLGTPNKIMPNEPGSLQRGK